MDIVLFPDGLASVIMQPPPSWTPQRGECERDDVARQGALRPLGNDVSNDKGVRNGDAGREFPPPPRETIPMAEK
ncbi:hypothetical protein M434DRAFT_395341 [Hypoxylon sp. CO27-5]|nr:hypothetical protein M434DRAFT_395341 [Hypoxylon sp. CO27-5]